jgi:uncharacterized protein (TIGR02145 family)
MHSHSLLFALTFIVSTTIHAQQYGSFKDSRDGRVYKTVKIGNQVWMAENLNVDRFRNGDPIPEARTKEEWLKADENKQPAWCYYDNNPANGTKYGKLYNWFAVNDSRGLAPAGYHIPSDAEWTQLTDFLGSEAGTKMKSTSGWKSYTSRGLKTCPNCKDWNAEYRKKVPCQTCKDTRSVPIFTHSGNGTNSSGFSGLPGGFRDVNGAFNDVGEYGVWWGSTENNTDSAWHRYLSYSSGYVDRNGGSKEGGLSVRCLRD